MNQIFNIPTNLYGDYLRKSLQLISWGAPAMDDVYINLQTIMNKVIYTYLYLYLIFISSHNYTLINNLLYLYVSLYIYNNPSNPNNPWCQVSGTRDSKAQELFLLILFRVLSRLALSDLTALFPRLCQEYVTNNL